MSESVIVALLALIGSMFGAYMTGTKTTAVIQERLNSLEEKVNKHNQLVERTYKLEKDVSTAFIRIDELREKINEK